MLAASFMLAGALACNTAAAYAEFGYYGGAYATPGISGCEGADGQGVNPMGGCAPGDYPLVRSTAYVSLADAYHDPGRLGQFVAASADLSLASLHAQFVAGMTPVHGVQGAANFEDRITVVGDLPAPVDVVVSLRVEYSVDRFGSTEPNRGNPGTPVVASLFWRGEGFTYVGALDVDGHNDCGRWAPDPTRVECEPVIIDGHQVHTVSRTLTVTDANRSFDFGAVLYAGAEDLQANASATLSFDLPAGLGYTSASGVFASNVPEPQAWAMFLAGLTCLGVRARRRSLR
jgi:hypothetical protein